MLDFINKNLETKIIVGVSILLTAMVALAAAGLYGLQATGMEDRFFSKPKILSQIGARCVGQVIEEGIEKGIFSESEVFEPEYQQIPGFVPPKYHTRFDAYLDREIAAFQDTFLKDDDILYAVAMDKNGYVPTHNSRFRKAHAGDSRSDYLGNRTKRIFTDAVAVNAVQNRLEGLVQPFPFDALEDAWNISSPIFVNGKHWGAFTIGCRSETVPEQKAVLFRMLLSGSLLFLGISLSVVFCIVRKAVRPLVDLTAKASHLADGDIKRKIRSHQKDEIGQIADALERLRISLKTAMDRLKKGP